MAGIKRNGVLGQLLRDFWLASAGVSHEGCRVQVGMTDGGRDILIGWGRCSDALRAGEN